MSTSTTTNSASPNAIDPRSSFNTHGRLSSKIEGEPAEERCRDRVFD
jgi:hypothetical protein